MASTNPVSAYPAGENKKPALVVTDRDIVFNCPTCRGELVVDRDGAGLEVPCSHCGNPLVVPQYTPRVAAPLPQTTAAPMIAQTAVTTQPVAQAAVTPRPVATAPAVQPEPAAQPAAPARTFDHSGSTVEQLTRRLDELKHQLKENRSQDTEMRGHVSRATMELHRLQLRLKKLQERHVDIQAELESILAYFGHSSS